MNRHVPSFRPVAKAHADRPSLMLRLALCGPTQLGVGLLVACIVPMMVRDYFPLMQGLSPASQHKALVSGACAVLVGYVIADRMGRYSAIRNLSHILPAFAIGYGLVICMIVFWRMDYSRFFLLVSFVNAQVWFHLITVIAQRVDSPRFDLVPFGKTKNLMALPHVRWKLLTLPDLQGRHPDGIVADLRADLPANWERFLAEATLRGVPVYHVKQLREDLTGTLEIEHMSESNLGSLLPSDLYLTIKQAIDMAFAVLLLPVIVPLFALVAVGIKLDSEGPVFFRQARVGYRGQVFTMWKFRTMRPDHSNGVDEREALMTRNGDPRIKRFGFFLRRTRLDELPQIVNILRGEMSWIGPRPEAVLLSRGYEKEIAFYGYRHIVPPGITGWAQVKQGHVTAAEDVRQKLHYDFYYIKNFSIWLDIMVALRTVAIMLSARGSR